MPTFFFRYYRHMHGCSLEGPIPSSISALTRLSDLYACNSLFDLCFDDEGQVLVMLIL